jgi:hypothetical protein
MFVNEFTTTDEGGCVTNDTEIGGAGADVIVIEADTAFVASATEVAVTVIFACEGTVLGAV